MYEEELVIRSMPRYKALATTTSVAAVDQVFQLNSSFDLAVSFGRRRGRKEGRQQLSAC